MKKFAAGPSVTLVAALVMLFASLAALLLANTLLGQLEEARGELRDTQSELQTMQEAKTDKGGVGPAAKAPGTVNKSQPRENTKSQPRDPKSSTREGQDQQRAILIGLQGEAGSSLSYLLLLSLGLVVLAALALAIGSALTLLSAGSRSSKTGSPLRTESSNPGRASPLEDEQRWVKLVEECVRVVDELDEHMGSFDAPRREVAGHVVLRLEEILGRSGVDIISDEAVFDRARHKPNAGHAATGDAVRETLSPGFAVGPRVLRRARVQLE